jgi:two-component system, NarL family, invasion response regulator UvrY
MIRILVVDDHSVVRKGVKQIVADGEGMEVTAEAASGAEALALVRAQKFDVVILDIAMPGRGGLDILRDLKAEREAPEVIVLSMHSEEQYAIRSLREGASAYLSKGGTPEELQQAIHEVAAGRKYFTSAVADRLAAFVKDESTQPLHEGLSDRELQVLIRIGSGNSSADTASELNLSIKTVNTYRSRILLKMGMETNAQLIRYAIKQGLVQ